jgi:hypothetical protein
MLAAKAPLCFTVSDRENVHRFLPLVIVGLCHGPVTNRRTPSLLYSCQPANRARAWRAIIRFSSIFITKAAMRLCGTLTVSWSYGLQFRPTPARANCTPGKPHCARGGIPDTSREYDAIETLQVLPRGIWRATRLEKTSTAKGTRGLSLANNSWKCDEIPESSSMQERR